MSDDQIWEQLDLRAKVFCETLEEALEGTSKDQDEASEDGVLEGTELRKVLLEGGDGLEELEGMDWDAEDYDDEGSEEEGEDGESDGESEDLAEDGMQELRDPSSEDEEEESIALDRPGKKRSSRGHPVLDDGFFDLASFNAEAEEGEAKSVSKGRLGEDDDDDSDGNVSVDLFAPVDDIDDIEVDQEDEDVGGGMWLSMLLLFIINLLL